MKRFFTTTFIVAVLTGCNSENNRPVMLKKVDSVIIHYFKGKEVESYGSSIKKQVDILAESITDAAVQKDRLPDTTGRIRFTQENNLVLEVYFTTPGTVSKFDAPVYAYEINGIVYGGRFTYKSGSLLEEFYDKLQSQ